MKDNVIRFWLTHYYLRKIGKRFPDFFTQLIDEVTDSYNEKRVMKERYINGKKFEIISFDLNMDIRYIYRLHKQVIEKLILL
jgi:hypothetical protein